MAQAVSEYEGKVDGEGNADKASDDEKEDPAFPAGEKSRGNGAAEDKGAEEEDQQAEAKENGRDFPRKGKTGATHSMEEGYPIRLP